MRGLRNNEPHWRESTGDANDMDRQTRRQMLKDYRMRKPPMGIVRIGCAATGDVFFGSATDTAALINGLGFKLDAGSYPNKALQGLWNEHGAAGFSMTVEELLEYDDPAEDQTDNLEAMLDLCLESHPEASRLRK